MGSRCYSTQLITGDGIFNTTGTENFTKEVKLAECGNSYVVVSIMGPQSGGKSTLLNLLFGTNFKEMDANKGKRQTTQGIWIAKSAVIKPCTLIMDVEGSDGRERGENDDTAFEKQSALFAVAVSDIVLINMSYTDINREHAGSRSLLKIVFEVMIKLFSPHKTTLMFVIRDKSNKIRLDILELDVREDIKRIWDSIPKPDNYKKSPLREFFNVEVVALSHFELEEVEFKKQVAGLRQRFFNSKSSGGLAGDREGVVPGKEFSLSAQEMWKVIKDNRDLDLPAHKILVATVRCDEVFSKVYDSFYRNKDWCKMKVTMETQPVPDFAEKFELIYNSHLLQYDRETAHFDDGVRCAKKKELGTKIMLLAGTTFKLMEQHIKNGRGESSFLGKLFAGGESNWVKKLAKGLTMSFLRLAAVATGSDFILDLADNSDAIREGINVLKSHLRS